MVDDEVNDVLRDVHCGGFWFRQARSSIKREWDLVTSKCPEGESEECLMLVQITISTLYTVLPSISG